jgi:uncharacterized protein (DUF1501 family)
MTISRRSFLKTATASLGVLIAPGALLRARPARAVGTDPVLVALYLRGAADGLSLVVPHGDPTYYAARPNIQIAPGTEIDLDGFFGLHPSLAPLETWYRSGRLALIHACGSASGTRSHFDEQDFMEFAAPGDKTVTVGWLNRFLSAAGLSTPLSSVSIENAPVKALSGPVASLAIPALSRFLPYGTSANARRDALRSIFAATGQPALASTGANALDLLDLLETIDKTTNVTYPASNLGSGLQDLAALIKADIGVRVAAVNHSSWDHHSSQPAKIASMASDLASSLAAFATDLGSDLDRTVVLVMTEFGRRVAENGGLGSDHGHGGVMMAFGGGVNGGNVLLRDGVWPGLEPADLFEGMDLAGTTDFRNVFAELLDRHMGLSSLDSIFPSFSVDAANYPGLFN